MLKDSPGTPKKPVIQRTPRQKIDVQSRKIPGETAYHPGQSHQVQPAGAAR
jgi:hypothetical protein